jgi:5'-nucleotidase (lipoprotein e(P4) family)
VLKTQNKPLAVVVDIDETMLDNSPFETALIDSAGNLSKWHNWTSKASARALPGALEFALYSQGKGVEIFYITNRDDNERTATLINLQKEGFPYANEDHLLTRSDLNYATGNTSSKSGRRAKVAENHTIVLLIGDNLNDFSEIFEDRSHNDGKEAVEKNREQFGKLFIVLPNPMYGAWEKPLYNYKDGLSEEQKTLMLKEKLLK